VSFDRADKVRGLDIIIVISAINKDHSFALLEKMNFPFIKKGEN
jgi:large subunit ribosomal protein L5